MNRHKGLEWAKVSRRAGEANPEKLWSLNEMERTGGEPDVVGHDKKMGEYIFYDCDMNMPKIKSVIPLNERHLLVTFVNGVQKIYDCQRILNLERFRLLKHEAFFKAVTVDPGGYGVSWDDETDLSEYELWNNGVEVEQGTTWSKEGAVVQQA